MTIQQGVPDVQCAAESKAVPRVSTEWISGFRIQLDRSITACANLKSSAYPGPVRDGVLHVNIARITHSQVTNAGQPCKGSGPRHRHRMQQAGSCQRRAQLRRSQVSRTTWHPACLRRSLADTTSCAQGQHSRRTEVHMCSSDLQ